MNNKISNFDRSSSKISKLEGCFTRWKAYKWDIFKNILEIDIKQKKILDVGCGSLLETYYLCKKCHDLTSLDLNSDQLQKYFDKYDWRGTKIPKLTSKTLEELRKDKEKFDIILTFDVIEHVESLESFLNELNLLLKKEGYIFVSVPNKFAITELYASFLLRVYKFINYSPPRGVPHLQFYSHMGWKKKFQKANFEIVSSDYVIGPINNFFYFLLTTILQNFLIVLEILKIISRVKRHSIMINFTNNKKMSYISQALNYIDILLKLIMPRIFTWNLFVLKKS